MNEEDVKRELAKLAHQAIKMEAWEKIGETVAEQLSKLIRQEETGCVMLATGVDNDEKLAIHGVMCPNCRANLLVTLFRQLTETAPELIGPIMAVLAEILQHAPGAGVEVTHFVDGASVSKETLQ